jgi:hypothetical protein
MTSLCTIEYGSRNTERRCGRAAVAECAHCGASVCSACAKECCERVLCGYCYDYHVIHSCLKVVQQASSDLFQSHFAGGRGAHDQTERPCSGSSSALTRCRQKDVLGKAGEDKVDTIQVQFLPTPDDDEPDPGNPEVMRPDWSDKRHNVG